MTEQEINQMSNVKAIQEFFSPGSKVEMSEMKALTKDDREELGDLARQALISEVTG